MLQSKLVSPLIILAHAYYKSFSHRSQNKLKVSDETDSYMECERDDAILLINARNWHFQQPEIENVAGWGSF
jgi:hypothetical protein